MAIPHVYTAVKPQDFTLTPFVIHKDYEIARSNLYTGSVAITGSGYKLIEALHFPEKLKLGTGATYPTNSFDGSYKYVIWHSINAMYYKVPYDMFGTFEHSNQNFTRKELSQTASVFSVPQHDFGEGIKPNSVQITSSFYNMADDGFGNIILSTSGSYTFAKQQNLVGGWDFNDVFKNPKSVFNKGSGYSARSYVLSASKVAYKSNTNNFNENQSFVTSGIFSKTVPISTNYTYASFPNSYMITDNQNEFNFANNEDFTISFNIIFDEFLDGTGSIISKRGTVQTQEYGNIEKLNENNVEISGKFLSSSYLNKSTNVYPYDFEARDNIVYFRRSDGVGTVELSSSFGYTENNSISVTKSGSLYSIYKDGALVDFKTNDRLGHCLNRHALMFGSLNTDLHQNLGASILFGNLRMYDVALTSDDLNYLHQNDYNAVSTDKIIGNVFYKQGFMMLTHPDGRYAKDFLDNNFTVKFQSTHTIYQYECLVRIKKGDYNITLNPTALQNPHSDLLLNSMTGSLEEGALFPYFTEIGLYNPEGDLLVVGKTSQPIQVRSDVDLNVLLRWDA